MGKLDTQAHTYTADSGLVIPLLFVNAMLIAAIQSDLTGQPKPPIVTVELAGRQQREENTDDPEYVERITEWRSAQKIKTMRSLFALGTNIPADPQWVRDYGSLMPDQSAQALRVFWLLTRLTNDESGELLEAIMSQSMPTEKGLELAGARFPSDDQRN